MLLSIRPNILLIYTGGTIGMTKCYKTGVLKVFNFSKLLENIPELVQLECSIQTVSFDEPIDSSNMNPEKWIKIASIIQDNYAIFDGFVVLHGSDTMSYSASALSFMLENLRKPVIFTGSQLPIGDLRTDAKENLITAIQIAAMQENSQAVVQEVGLYFEYKLYRGNRTTKINAERFNAFASPNYPLLIESGVSLKVNIALKYSASNTNELTVHKILDDNVVIIKIFPGLNATILSAILEIKNLKGVVLETYGAGNATTDEWLITALRVAIQKGIYVINVTQCSAGSVNMQQYETGTALQKIGVISAKDCTTEAAITKLMFLLGQNLSPSIFKNTFESSLRGEMT